MQSIEMLFTLILRCISTMKIKSMLLDIDIEDCVHRCVDDSACGKTVLASIALQDATFNGTVILLLFLTEWIC